MYTYMCTCAYSPLGGTAKVINYEMMELLDIMSPPHKLPEVSRFLNIATDKVRNWNQSNRQENDVYILQCPFTD